MGLGHDDLQVILVDDGSTDGSVEWVRAHYPSVSVVPMGHNTKRLNAVRNRALESASTRYVMLIDNDVAINRECLAELLGVMRGRERVLCCTPRLLYSDDAQRVYHDGGGLHFLCVSTHAPRGTSVAELPASPPKPTIGCGIMLIDREIAAQIGFFDEGYAIGWGDDGEFHIRGRIRGFHALHVPAAACLHVERPHGPARIYGQLHNRYRTLWCNYSVRSLVMLGPALCLFELCLAVAMGLKGNLPPQFRAVWHVIRDHRELTRLRREIQSTRRVADRDILLGKPLLPTGNGSRSRVVRLCATVVNGLLQTYWRMARRWV